MVVGVTALLVRCETIPEVAEEVLLEVLNQTPTERIVTALEYAGIPSQLGMLAFYDRFLEKMRDEDVRSSLDDVEFGGRHMKYLKN